MKAEELNSEVTEDELLSHKSISFLIKPASGTCNMRCKYCFYEDESEHREQKNYGIMSFETAEQIIKCAFDAIDYDGQINFAFQGGEPTLAGLEFFKHFTDFADNLKTENTVINYSIQTNGYKTDLKWAEFFKEHNFLVGVSIDGNKKVHDRNRIDVMAEGTYLRIVDSIKLFNQVGVDINALCVVTSQTDPFKAYSDLKKLGFKYIQYIPCLDPYEEDRGKREYSLSPKYYRYFLCNTFDLWFNDWKSGKYVSIRLFDDYVHILMGLPASTCATLGKCGGYFVSEADGSLFPCDFYMMDKWCLGNINEAKDKKYLKNLFNSEKMQTFIARGTNLPEDCKKCRYLNICNGGCKRDRDFCGEIQKNFFCETFKAFFEYAGPRLMTIVKEEKAFLSSVNN